MFPRRNTQNAEKNVYFKRQTGEQYLSVREGYAGVLSRPLELFT